MAISLDNSIIDFATISNIITTLNTHEDQFQSFESNDLVRISDLSSSGTGTSTQSLNAISVAISGVRNSGEVGTPIAITYPITFASQPVVIATVENAGDYGLFAQVVPQSTTNGINGALSGCSVIVNATKTVPSGTNVVVNVIAIGQR